MQQRHVPGPPITREKLEASVRNDTKRSLTQLKRFSDGKRSSEEKEIWDNQGNKERKPSELWSESTEKTEVQTTKQSSNVIPDDKNNKVTTADNKEAEKSQNGKFFYK